MERIPLQAKMRDKTGKGAARSLRREEKIPAVLYGRDCPSQKLMVEDRELKGRLGRNIIIDLIIDGDKPRTVIVKDLQRDVLKGTLLHVDFQQISLDEKITTTVLLSIEGTAPGMREGGVLQQLMREIEVECLPTDIPEHILVDISQLQINESITIGDLDILEDIRFVTPPEEVVASIVVPTEEIEEEEVEEEIIQPEVIGEDPDVEEEDGEREE